MEDEIMEWVKQGRTKAMGEIEMEVSAYILKKR